MPSTFVSHTLRGGLCGPDKTERDRSPPNGPGLTSAISKRETASRRQIQPRRYIPGSLDKERGGKDSAFFGETEWIAARGWEPGRRSRRNRRTDCEGAAVRSG